MIHADLLPGDRETLREPGFGLREVVQVGGHRAQIVPVVRYPETIDSLGCLIDVEGLLVQRVGLGVLLPALVEGREVGESPGDIGMRWPQCPAVNGDGFLEQLSRSLPIALRLPDFRQIVPDGRESAG